MGIWTALETLSQSGYCLTLRRCKPGFDLSSRFLPCGLGSRKSQRSKKEAQVGAEGFGKLPGPLRSCSIPSTGEATTLSEAPRDIYTLVIPTRPSSIPFMPPPGAGFCDLQAKQA